MCPPPILNNPCNQILFYNLSRANHKALQRTTASLSILISLQRQYLLEEKYFSVFIDNISHKKNISLSSPTISLKRKIFLCLPIFHCLNRHYFSSTKKQNNSLFPPQVIAVQAPSSLLVAGFYQNHCISLATSCFALR